MFEFVTFGRQCSRVRVRIDLEKCYVVFAALAALNPPAPRSASRVGLNPAAPG